MSDRKGWFADPGDTDEEGYDPRYPWRPYLAADGIIVPIDVWFRSKEDCERFIREQVLGKGMLDDPDLTLRDGRGGG